MYGDKRDWYRINVVDGPESDEERIMLLGFFNMICGNVEYECAYAVYHFWNSEVNGRNTMNAIGKFYYIVYDINYIIQFISLIANISF